MSIIEKAMEKAQQERAKMGKQENYLDPTALKDEVHPKTADVNDTTLATELNVTETIMPEDDSNVIIEQVNAHSTNQQTVFENQPKADLKEVEQPKPNTNENPTQASQIKVNPSASLIMANQNTLIEGGSYRIFKEYIIALRKSQPDKSVFMITSPMKGEGKTLVTCNLACALASEFDTTVLLIDADLRAPMCHHVLGIENPPKGLSDCILHNTPISDCLIHTGIGKLSLLCAGSLIENPAELITSKKMQDLILEIKNRYPNRIIIIDSLPLLPFAESRALSRMTDGVMLVVRENVTYKRHLENALSELQDVPLLGMIYNAATTSGADKEIYDLSSYAY